MMRNSLYYLQKKLINNYLSLEGYRDIIINLLSFWIKTFNFLF